MNCTWVLYSVAASLIHPHVMIQGVIATPSMSKHVDGFGRTTFHMQVCSAHILLLLLCIMCTLVCSLIPRSPLQPSKRRVCFEANLYHALMTRPCSLIFCYAYLYTPHIHQKVRIGRCVCVGGGGFIFSEIE